MRFRRLIAGVVASGMLAASACLPQFAATEPGDINGDCQTNILDMQIVADALLHGAVPATSADINRDGRIDVLDFQRLVTETSRPVSEKSKHHSTLLEAYVGAAPARFHAAKTDVKKYEAAVVDHASSLIQSLHDTVFCPKLPAAAPAVRGPSPHSPPLAA